MTDLSKTCGQKRWQIVIENAFVDALLTEEKHIAQPQALEKKE